MKDKKKSIKKTVIWLVLAVLAILSTIIIFTLPDRTNYTQIKATIGNLSTYYTFAGSVETKNRQTIFGDKIIRINKINVSEGQKVSPSTILMTTDSGDEIKSNISGEISSIYVSENIQIMPGEKLIDIIDYSNLQLKVLVDEYDLSAISTKKDAIVTIHSLKKDINSKITYVSKEGQYQNGVTNFSAIIPLPIDKDLRVGMSAEAKVLNQSISDVVILPMSAIQFDDMNNPYVLKKSNKNLPLDTQITLGMNDGVSAQITSGILADEIILVPPAPKLNNFANGRPINQEVERPPQEIHGGTLINE